MNISDQQKLLAEEAARRRAAALADYERRQSPAPTSIDSQFASVFPDTPSAEQNQAADTACSASDSSGSCGGGE